MAKTSGRSELTGENNFYLIVQEEDSSDSVDKQDSPTTKSRELHFCFRIGKKLFSNPSPANANNNQTLEHGNKTQD